MELDRKHQPSVRELEQINIPFPEKNIMPNGVPLYLIKAGEQEVVRMDILIKGGSWQQSQKLQALFTNRMLREGTARFTSADIAQKLDYYGAWLELTSSFQYGYITVYSLNKYFREVLEIIESIIKEPIFPDKELNTAIEANLQQFRINSTKVDFLAHRSLQSSLFGNMHPCGKLVVESDYTRINSNVLREFYEQHYNNGNCTVYLSGLVTDDFNRPVEAAFGTDTFGKIQPEKPGMEYIVQPVAAKRIFTEQPDSLQSAIKLGRTTITRAHPDYHKLRVMLTIFGGYFGSRLMSNIREDKGYTYGIGASTFFFPGTGMIVVSTETANEFVEPLINEVYHEIDRLQTDLVGEEELSIVRNYMLGETSRSYETAFSLSDAWMFIQTTGLPDDFFSASVDAIRTVNAAEIRELACRYLCKEDLKEIIVGKNIS